MDRRLIGYARVSTREQSLNPQTDVLTQAGVVELFTDVASGSRDDRPGLERCLESLQAGDVLVVVRLDRLGRSMRHLVEVVHGLSERAIGFKSLTESIDTTSPTGQLVFHIFAALAEFERRLIIERTRAGLESARSRGRAGGRRAVRWNNPKVVSAKRMADTDMAVADICNALGISQATFYRYLKIDPPQEHNAS